MTREELILRLTEIADSQGQTARWLDSPVNEEVNHLAADRALLDFIDDPEVTAWFERIDKWYA